MTKVPEYELLPLTPAEMNAEENSRSYREVDRAYIEASTDSTKRPTRTQEKEGFLIRKFIN